MSSKNALSKLMGRKPEVINVNGIVNPNAVSAHLNMLALFKRLECRHDMACPLPQAHLACIYKLHMLEYQLPADVAMQGYDAVDSESEKWWIQNIGDDEPYVLVHKLLQATNYHFKYPWCNEITEISWCRRWISVGECIVLLLCTKISSCGSADTTNTSLLADVPPSAPLAAGAAAPTLMPTTVHTLGVRVAGRHVVVVAVAGVGQGAVVVVVAIAGVVGRISADNSVRYNSRYTARGFEKRIVQRDDKVIVFGHDLCQTTLGPWKSFYHRIKATASTKTETMREEDPSRENVNVTVTPNFPLLKEMIDDGLVVVMKTDANLLEQIDTVTLSFSTHDFRMTLGPKKLFDYKAFDPILNGMICASHNQSDASTSEYFSFCLNFGRNVSFKVFSIHSRLFATQWAVQNNPSWRHTSTPSSPTTTSSSLATPTTLAGKAWTSSSRAMR
ncbi:hypothetical protein BC936DRAFT_141449 [Jimgerdemannia flammicorona]|uniref:Uncharacterized protein n=1 Tax=Jimgerdemannia flammicorona TaxID=994334 RepID=A0A433DG21_9FUNG|nr:hypothetical protein BC936DRAFT_141449 [Jimgerdemannia flammicorona]